MGMYLNPGDDKFQKARRSPIYVDKSGLISYLNKVFDTENRFVCVSRPRRFGKSMAANMIAAYYDRSSISHEIFSRMKIAESDDFARHLGKYDVIQLNMQDFLSSTGNIEDMLALLQKSLLWDLLEAYPSYRYFDESNLMRTMADVYRNTKRPFVIIIDEWDCIFRECQQEKVWQDKYLDFLRSWLKDKAYIGLAYITGILPIKKYSTHSALNMFTEFSMTTPGPLAEFVGFTEEEVRQLCREHRMDFDECKAWYDGYRFSDRASIYSPRSVVQSMMLQRYDTYWNKTETFEALKVYIDMNYDGLREAIIALMAGDERKIDTSSFVNDMTSFHDMDDVLTLLVHLGYLGYDIEKSCVFIPNREILQEYATAVKIGGWDILAKALKASESLLASTLALDAEAVARSIESAHMETSHLSYNDENALSYTISLAYYAARQKYLMVREFPTGKGFADLVFLPRPPFANLPALLLELKWDKTAETALKQIETKNYPQSLKDYVGEILLVGISYDKGTKKHECLIERCNVPLRTHSAGSDP